MQTSKLIKVLKTLNTAELKQFSDWVKSPFFNKNEKILQLWELLQPFAPHFESPDLKKEFLYKNIYKNNIYKNLTINNLISDLYQILSDFLAYQNFQTTRQLPRICLMDALHEKGLPSLVAQEAAKFQEQQAKNSVRNASFYFDEYLFFKQMDALFLSKPNRTADLNLQLKNDRLDLFYFATKLKIACDMTSRNAVIQANYRCDFLSELLAVYEANPTEYEALPSISIYYRILKMLQNPTESYHYQHLRDLLHTHLDRFPKEELRTLYDYARNHCIRQINNGETVYYQEILGIYQFLLDQEIIFQNGYLTEWDYKNIITVGVRLEAFEWTERFIHTYKNHLPFVHRENAFRYNLAAFYYARKAYKQSLQLLHEVKFTDTTYHLGAKTIQLKSYFELEEAESFYALCEAFQIFVKRNRQLSDYRKAAYLSFVNYSKKLFQLREQKGVLAKSVWQNRSQKLLQSLENQQLANKDWLLEIFESLVKKEINF